MAVLEATASAPVEGRPRLKGRERKVLRAIVEHLRATGHYPTIRELRVPTGISSTSVVNTSLDLLEDAGWIERTTGGEARGIRLVGAYTVIPEEVKAAVGL